MPTLNHADSAQASLVHGQTLDAINVLSRALAETLELERIYELLFSAVSQLIPGTSGAIITLFYAERQELCCAFALLEGERLDTSAFPALQLAPPGQGFQSDVIHTRRPVIIPNQTEMQKRTTQMHLIGSEGNADETPTESILLVPMLSRKQVIGVLQVQSFAQDAFGEANVAQLGLAANVAAVAIENAHLVADLQRSNEELLHAYDSTLEGWARALDLRDQETYGHSQRVTELTVRLAEAAGIHGEALRYVRWGALLHDIGKVGIPDAILLKPGPLTPEEWAVMRQHPVLADQLLSPIAFLHAAMDIPRYHHERWDGTGYPCGLEGEAIPLAARLFAVVDVWDALRSARPYREALSDAQARAYLEQVSGTHLDPSAVCLFFAVMNQADLLD